MNLELKDSLYDETNKKNKCQDTMVVKLDDGSKESIESLTKTVSELVEINSEKFKQDYIILTYDKLAEKYGISRSSVREIVKQLGLSKKRGVKKKIIVKEN